MFPFGLTIKKPENQSEKPLITTDDMKEEILDNIIRPDEGTIPIWRSGLCYYTENGQNLVIKFGNHSEIHGSTKFNLLKNEHMIYNRINNIVPTTNPFFPRFIGAGSYNNEFYYIIIENIGGITLSNYLENSILSVHNLLIVMLNLTTALETLWNNNIIHGDLSIDNVIVIEPSLDVKIIDFETSYPRISYTNASRTNIFGTLSNEDDLIQYYDPMAVKSSYIPDKGTGYFYLLLKITSITGNKNNFYKLLNNIYDVIKYCEFEDCGNVYSKCRKILKTQISGLSAPRNRSRSRSRPRNPRRGGAKKSRKNQTTAKYRKTPHKETHMTSNILE